MALFDNNSFLAPNMDIGKPPNLQLARMYRDTDQRNQLAMQKDLINFQSRKRLQDLADMVDFKRTYGQDASNPGGGDGSSGRMPSAPLMLNGMNDFQRGQLNVEQEKADEIKRNNLAKNTATEEGLDIKKDVADNPNYGQIKDAAGNITFIDKKSGRVINTGIASNQETDAQKAADRINLENTRGSNQINLENTRQTGRQSNINLRSQGTLTNTKERGNQDRLTKQSPSANSSVNMPTQQVKAQQLKAQQIINENPDMAPYIHIDPNTGMVNIDQPSVSNSLWSFGKSGPTNDVYHNILSKLYGGTNTVQEGPAPQSASPNTGKVRVKDRNGNPGVWDLSKGPVPNGFTVLGGGE